MTLVSVIIPTKNRTNLLKDAIESVLAVQRQDFDLEIIVIDDGSTDDTAAVVARYPVIYLQTKNIGAAGTRNAGITAASGDFIAFLDDDDVWLSTNITPQLNAFAMNPSYGAVHAQVILTGPDRSPWGEPVPPGPLSSGWIFQDLLDYWPQVGSLVVRRSVLQDVGGFDLTLRSEEDWDLILRIARRYQFGRVAEPVALFRQRGDDGEDYLARCIPDTIKVFHRHTCREPMPRRLLLQRKLWQHRGWYVAQFMERAQAYAECCQYRRALHSMRYAWQASPPHALLRYPSVWRSIGACIASRVRFSAASLDILPTSLYARSELREIWRASLVRDGFADPIDSALCELSHYFRIPVDEVRERCLHWEKDSMAEWDSRDRSTPEGIREFYQTTQSWIFDTVWYHAQQYHGQQPAESIMIAERLSHVNRGCHLDFGSGPGSTSIFFQKLGWQSALADISTTLLEFARWRFAERGLTADFYDLNTQSLPAGQFDLITACDVMVHVPDPAATLRQMHRALRMGGLLVFNVNAQPGKGREHLYPYAYPVLRPVRGVGFQKLPRLDFFHVYRKIAPRSPMRALVIRIYDLARYNRLVAAVGDVRRAIAHRR